MVTNTAIVLYTVFSLVCAVLGGLKTECETNINNYESCMAFSSIATLRGQTLAAEFIPKLLSFHYNTTQYQPDDYFSQARGLIRYYPDPSPFILTIFSPREDYGQDAIIQQIVNLWFKRSEGGFKTWNMNKTKYEHILRMTPSEIVEDVIPEIERTIFECPTSLFFFSNVFGGPAIKLLDYLQDLRFIRNHNGEVVNARKSVFILHITDHQGISDLSEPSHHLNEMEITELITSTITKNIVDQYLNKWNGSRTRITVVPIWTLSQLSKRKILETSIHNTLTEISSSLYKKHGIISLHFDDDQIHKLLEMYSPAGKGTTKLHDRTIDQMLYDGISLSESLISTCTEQIMEGIVHEEITDTEDIALTISFQCR